MTKEEIGRIIKESRISADLTQLQVAKKLGRPQQTIASWESGKSQPDANTLFELFAVLGRSVDEAFGFTQDDPPLSSEALKAARDFEGLSPYGKRCVLKEIEKHQMLERHLYENLKIFRTKRNMTQQKLAEKSGVSLERIREFEDAEGQTRLDDLIRDGEIIKIAEALETDPHQLMGLNSTYEKMKYVFDREKQIEAEDNPATAPPESPPPAREGTDTTPEEKPPTGP